MPARSRERLARGYDDFSNPPCVGRADCAERPAGCRREPVWQQAGTPQVPFDCPGRRDRTLRPGRCLPRRRRIREHGPPHSVRSHPRYHQSRVSARPRRPSSATANTTTCLKPWAMPDEWHELGSSGHWQPTDEFNRWDAPGTLVARPGQLHTVPARTGGYEHEHLGPLRRLVAVRRQLSVHQPDHARRSCCRSTLPGGKTLPTEHDELQRPAHRARSAAVRSIRHSLAAIDRTGSQRRLSTWILRADYN